MLDPKTVDMFYFNGYKHTAPNCPVEMRPNLNPSSGAQSYRRSTSDCGRPSYYNIPFFLDRPGPKFEEWSVNAHEARPGHHTQVAHLHDLHQSRICGRDDDNVSEIDALKISIVLSFHVFLVFYSMGIPGLELNDVFFSQVLKAKIDKDELLVLPRSLYRVKQGHSTLYFQHEGLLNIAISAVVRLASFLLLRSASY